MSSNNIPTKEQIESKRSEITNLEEKLLFNDARAGIVVTSRSKEGGSKLRHIIMEHERLRRAKAIQDKLINSK